MKKTRTKRVQIACDRAYKRGRADMAVAVAKLLGEVELMLEALEARVKALEEGASR